MIILKASIRKLIVDFVDDKDIVDKFYCSEMLIIIVLALLELPLVLQKKIEKLRFLSFAGVAGIVIFIVGVVTHYIVKRAEGFEGAPMNAFPEDWYEAISVMPNLIFAYDYQTNFFPIYKGLRNATDKKMNLASAAGISACGASYLLIGMIGYSLAGKDVAANFLESIPYIGTHTSLFLIINVFFLISIGCAYSLIFFSCRNNFIAMVNLLSKVRRNYKQKVDDGSSSGVIT
jgi:amino acid permease